MKLAILELYYTWRWQVGHKKRLQSTESHRASVFFFFQIKSCLVANYFWIDSFSKFSHFFGKFTSGSLREDVSLAKGIFKRFPFRREISSWSPLRTRLLDQVWLKEEWSQLTLPTHLQANPQRQKNFQKSL